MDGLMEGTRNEYIDVLADDVFGVLLAAVVGTVILGGIFGGGKAVSAAGRAVGGKRNPSAAGT